MPTAALRPCLAPHCSNLVARGRCPEHGGDKHGKFQDPSRATASARGYGAAWKRLRAVVLAEQPLCLLCEQEGRVGPATHVDHIVPKAAGGTDDRTNLRGLCASHHNEKTAREHAQIRRGTYRPT